MDSLVTDTDLPTGDLLRGVWLLVLHPEGYTQGCEIDSVLTQDGRTIIQLAHDHGLIVRPDECREVYFPGRTFAGPTRFRIPTSAALPGST